MVIELLVTPYGGRTMPIPYEEAQLRGLLKQFDSDEDGCLSKDDLRKAFKSLGSRAPRIRAHFARVKSDCNHNSYIDGEDELDLLVKYAKRHGYSVI